MALYSYAVVAEENCMKQITSDFKERVNRKKLFSMTHALSKKLRLKFVTMEAMRKLVTTSALHVKIIC